MECSLCRDTGWLLECKDKNGVSTMEIIPCLIPECGASGKKIQLLSVNMMEFTHLASHPKDSTIMSLIRE